MRRVTLDSGSLPILYSNMGVAWQGLAKGITSFPDEYSGLISAELVEYVDETGEVMGYTISMTISKKAQG